MSLFIYIIVGTKKYIKNSINIINVTHVISGFGLTVVLFLLYLIRSIRYTIKSIIVNITIPAPIPSVIE